METTHTPGPWSYGPASNYSGFWIAPTGRLPTLAAVQDGKVESFNFPEQTEANARLISAAPDLLSALEKVMNRHASNVLFHDSALADQCWNAITKARGAA